MPNIATILKEEIVRLARKELKKELEGLKKASATYRSEIAALKRRIVALEKQAAHISKKATKPKLDTDATTRVRFSAKGFASKRQKLGLSAEAMGTLLGVSAQTVYNWEAGKTQPRKVQVVAIAGMRKMGKRQVKAALEKAGE
jgi:DNA-binding transcriptional regulator YiaG